MNFLLLIENKIDSKAGADQLAKYKAAAEVFYPNHRRLFVYLTPGGTPPDDSEYVAFSYVEIAHVLETLANEDIASDTAVILRHYVEMLRRHIVPDEKLRDLARQLYERHRDAFTFIDQCKPQLQSMIGIARTMFEADAPGLVKDSETSSLFRFVPEEWNDVPALNACPPLEWSKSGRNLLFEVKTYGHESYAARVNVALIVGPAEPAIRSRLYDGARDRPDTFVGLVKPMGAKWATIFARDLLGASAGKDLAMDERAVAVNVAWADFLTSTLPTLKAGITEIIGSATIANIPTEGQV